MSIEGSYRAQGYVSCQSSCHGRDTRFRFEFEGLLKLTSTSELDDVPGLGDDDLETGEAEGEAEREWVNNEEEERERRKLGEVN